MTTTIKLLFWFGRVFLPAGLDTGTNGVVNWCRSTVLRVQFLFVFGIDKRIVAVLASKDFVRHGYL